MLFVVVVALFLLLFGRPFFLGLSSAASVAFLAIRSGPSLHCLLKPLQAVLPEGLTFASLAEAALRSGALKFLSHC